MDGRRLEEPESHSRFSICCFWSRRFGNAQGKRRFCNRARSVCRSCCRVAIFLSRLRHGRLSERFEPAIRGALAREKIPHEYRELPGDHNWAYWDQQVQEVLQI